MATPAYLFFWFSFLLHFFYSGSCAFWKSHIHKYLAKYLKSSKLHDWSLKWRSCCNYWSTFVYTRWLAPSSMTQVLEVELVGVLQMINWIRKTSTERLQYLALINQSYLVNVAPLPNSFCKKCANGRTFDYTLVPRPANILSRLEPRQLNVLALRVSNKWAVARGAYWSQLHR